MSEMSTSKSSSSSDYEEDVFSFLNTISIEPELELEQEPEPPVCFSCCGVITDPYFLRAGDHVWHEHCLRCCVCQAALDAQGSCFYRDGNIFCRRDYNNIFDIKCTACSRPIQSGDWVRSAREHVYHLACFACSICQRQLSTGEEFAIHEDNVLCRAHVMDPDHDLHNNRRKKNAKRFRTAFTDEQVEVLQKYFKVDSNPAGRDLDLIAREAGLPRRVAQVWFQNARAKEKKNMC